MTRCFGPRSGRPELDRHYCTTCRPVALRRCAAVITISESSRSDIAARWPFLAGRVTVWCRTGLRMSSSTLRRRPCLIRWPKRWATRPTCCTWAARSRVRLMELLARSGRDDLHLVGCGFAADMARSQAILPGLVGRVHFAPFVDGHGDMVTLYRRALAVLYPTLYEGFGFPAVEAQAAGTPVLFSPVSSLVDLVGPLAWTPAAEDFGAWQAALYEVLSLSPESRSHRATDGQTWARQFSWRRSIQRHLELFREVLAGGIAQ